MTPTPEQQSIIDAAVGTTDSLLISALAGAAKTTTLELICKALPSSLPILSIAFNKRIADEMGKRLPGNVMCATINSVGHRVWSAATGRRLVVNTKKSYEILKACTDDLKTWSQKNDARDTFAETLAGIRLAKVAGYVPGGRWPNAKPIVNGEFFESFDEEPTGFQIDLINKALDRSIEQSYQGQIDFDDQIYMPALFGGSFPRFPLVMVDEAQDLSPLNHAILDKLVTNRIIAVGDPFQSIYAFRGADTASMSRLRSRFGMVDRGLSVSFRCPQEIVKLARARAPHMQWAEWAVEGSVKHLEQWGPNDIPDGAAIICRNNAPLFSCAMALIRGGRGVHLVGTDLGPGLVRTLRKLGPEGLTQAEVFDAIDKWETERLKKKKSAAIADKAECLRVFAGFGQSLRDAITYAEHLFSSKGPIQLLSGHKAKGLEWDTVYHLDPWRIPSPFAHTDADLDQEANLRYVITTRAKKELFFVNMEGYDG